jgi:hypothetical protein
MVEAGFILVAGELAVFTERNKVEPVAIGIEVVLGEIFVPIDVIGGAKLFGLVPGFGFDADKFNVASVGVFFEQAMAELVEKF